jgi:hypothetical protein
MIAAPYPSPADTRYFADLSLDPIACRGWQIEEHRRAVDSINVIVWDPARVELYVDDTQKNGNVDGFMLRKSLRGKPILNANVLDFLLANPRLIPEDWKKDELGKPRRIFFFGTIYCRPNDDLYVRYLCFDGEKWGWGVHWLGAGRQDNEPAALWHIE